MANVRTILSFLSYTPTATSEQADFPATLLSDYLHPFRPWKATAYGSTVDVTLDFGSGKTFSGLATDPGIFLNPVNVTSIRIQGNSTPSWSSPPWDQPVTISEDRWNGRYKGFWRLADLNPAAFSYRYLNIRIPAQSSVDLLPYRIGSAHPGSVTEWTVNYATQGQRNRLDKAREVEMPSGGSEISTLGEPRMVLTLPRKLYSLTALNEQLDVLNLGLDQPFVMWDAGLGNGSQDAYLVRRSDAMPLTQTFLQYHEGSLVLKEVV